MDLVHLSKGDVFNLQRRLIGRGTDGNVYDVGNGILYKIYHDSSFFSDIDVLHPLLDGIEDDIKIYQRGNSSLFRNNDCSYFKYIDSSGVRISGQESIMLAIQRQKNIRYTQLPLAPIYVNSRFKGCVLRKHKLHFQLHYFSFLSEARKRQILLLIMDRVEELVRLYIYPLDVCNRPIGDKLSHSNILLSLFGIPQLIDVDGKSTIYMEQEDEFLLQQVLRGLNVLTLEFLYCLDINDEMLHDDILELEQFLYGKGLPENCVDKLLTQEADFTTLRKVLKL